MATEEPSLGDTNLAELLGAIAEAYEQMHMPVRQYLLLVLAPAVVFFLLTTAVVIAVDLPLLVALPLPLLGILGVFTALVYPKLLLEQERKELENHLHLLITHMTVLSTTNIDRMEVFRRLSEEEEYGALAEEINRIVQLVDAWNQSLDDACRRRAKQVPSDAMSDFLDRLAYTLGAGQELPDFLLSEQSVILDNYATVYEGALDNLEVMKDLYLSMILSMTFGLVFAIVLPVLTGTDPTMTVAAVIVMYVFVQMGFTYAINTVTPDDPVWYEPTEIEPRGEARLRWSVIAGGGLSLLLVAYVGMALLGTVPRPKAFLPVSLPIVFFAVIPLTPLLIPGVVVRQAEQDIHGRDEEFPSFIRALGSTESAKQSTTSAVLEDLRTKDFGPLTPEVNNLYKRLNMRIEPERAWAYFAADSQSYLIQKFSEMYQIGRQMGGEPKQLGELISQNMNRVLQLRERREQSTITLIGLVYGITAASTFAFFIGLQVVNLLSGLTLDLEAVGSFDFTSLIQTAQYDIPVIKFLLIVVVLFNALVSSLMIRAVDDGHKINAFLHFVLLSWLGAIVAVGTQVLVKTVVSI
ncbi:MAG: archaellar assembly protein FlaJ [Haloarculaceae archaeon]